MSDQVYLILLNELNQSGLYQNIFLFLNIVLSAITVYFAFKIGSKQNRINEQALKLNDYADVFLCHKG
jgi:cbb3-type cytochrome oxidase subunit 3